MSDDKPIKIRTGLSVRHAANADYNETIEGPPRSAWNAMDADQREAYLDAVAETTLSNQISAYAVVDDD